MRMDHESSLTPRWIVFGTALVYFALGSVLTAHFMHLKEAWADSHHVFQMEIYHAVPGKVPAGMRFTRIQPSRSICNRERPSSLSKEWTQRLCGQRITRQ